MAKVKIKATENKARDVESKLPQNLPVASTPKMFLLPNQLRQTVINALLTSSPKVHTVEQINQILNALAQLKVQ